MSRMIAVMLALAPLSAACAAAPDAVVASSALSPTAPQAAFTSDRVQVIVDGEAGLPDLVLIPGLSSSPDVWDETVAQLSGRYRIHRIHVNGFAGADAGANGQDGQTPRPVIAPVAEEIARYIREQNLDKPAVIGHSMGGTMGMMVAARHPDLVGKLMVVDMVPFMGAMFGPPGSTVETVTPVADQVWSGQAKISHEAYVAAATPTITGMINNEARREEALQHMRDSDQQVSAAAFRELIVTDLRSELPAITAPVSVLYVKFNDARMTNEITDMIYSMSFASRPGTTLKRIDDSAHFIMFDQPQRFAAEVDAFLSAN